MCKINNSSPDELAGKVKFRHDDKEGKEDLVVRFGCECEIFGKGLHLKKLFKTSGIDHKIL